MECLISCAVTFYLTSGGKINFTKSVKLLGIKYFQYFQKNNIKQERFLVGCVPLLQPAIDASLLDVRTRRVPEVNKSEQVSSDTHQMSLRGAYWDWGWGWVVLRARSERS